MPAFTDPSTALAWLEAERENLVAVAADAPDSSGYINTCRRRCSATSTK
jgi:hypothetical protein